jgi:hypothetical protein
MKGANMPVKCTASFKEIAFVGDETIADMAIFWRDSETREHLFSVTAHVAVPAAMKNTDEIKSYALQKMKELIAGAADAEYE